MAVTPRLRGVLLVLGLVGLAAVATTPAAGATAPHYRVSVALGRSAVELGSRFHVRVRVSPTAAGRPVLLQRREPTGWRTVERARLGRRSSCAMADHLATRSASYRVVVLGDHAVPLARSRTLTVTATVHHPPPAVPTPAPAGWRSIDLGTGHGCGIRWDDTAWCWGLDDYGQLGNGTVTSAPGPVRVQVPGAWRQISVGTSLYREQGHTCGIKLDGSAWCWGYNGDDQLGTADRMTALPHPDPAPLDVPAGTRWLAISAGEDDTCGIESDGTLWCWGSSTTEVKDFIVPTEVDAGPVWTDVSVGGDHACGLKADHTAWCWGSNFYGALASIDLDRSATPVQIGSDSDWTSITSGDSHSCGLRGTTAWCWGRSTEGQLGSRGHRSEEPVPSQVDNAVAWRKVVAGGDHTCGIDTIGFVWCWGDGADGEIGNGYVGSPNVPAFVGFGYRDVAVGTVGSCATRTDGDALCWGRNGDGQLGNPTGVGTVTPVTSPVPLG